MRVFVLCLLLLWPMSALALEGSHSGLSWNRSSPSERWKLAESMGLVAIQQGYFRGWDLTRITKYIYTCVDKTYSVPNVQSQQISEVASACIVMGGK